MSSLGQRKRDQARSDVSFKECVAIRLLHDDGQAIDEIAFRLERSESSVRHHLSGECTHTHPVPAGADLWDEVQAALDVGHLIVREQDATRLGKLAKKLASLSQRAQERGEMA